MKRGTVLRLSRYTNRSVIIRCGLFSLILLAILSPSRLMPFKAQAKQTTFGKDGGSPAGKPSYKRLNSDRPQEGARDNNENAPSLSAASVKKAAERTSAAPVVSGPGRLIFAVGGVFNGFLMTNTDGTNPVNLTDSGAAQVHHPSVSPQTGMIAFDAESIHIIPALPDRDRRIFVMNGDGSGVRQITFIPTGADPTFTKDFNPEISPDGTKVAFMSQRTAGQVHTCQNNQTTTTQNEVWVVNVDGTNLQQVTHPKYLDDINFGCQSGNNYAVAWSPDSQQLAILGQRPYTFQKINVGAKGLYFAISIGDADQGIAYNFGTLDGADKEPVMKARIKGGPGFIDWAPSSTIMFSAVLGGFLGEDASSIGYLRPGIAFCGVDGGGASTGGTGGGFADCTRASTLVGQVGYGGTTDGQPHGGNILGAPGSVRYSPDGAGLAFAGTSPLANNNLAPTVFVGSGSNPILPSQGSGHLDGGLSWPAGAAIPKPDKLVLAPAPLVLYDQHSVQVTPTLLDAQGNIIVRAAVWRGGDAGFHCDNTPDQVTCFGNQLGDSNVDFTGTVTGRSFESVGNLCATNGGLRACMPYYNSNTTPVLTVAATGPVASVDNATPGVFTITRSGAPNALALAPALQIPFRVSGTAAQGVDFVPIGQVAMIPAGQTSTAITVTPLFNPLNRGDKTVTLALDGGNTSNYYVGFPADRATITITGSTSPPPALSVLKITPNKGGDGGAVAVSVFGQSFNKNATLKLVSSGLPDINVGLTQVNDAGTSLKATLNLIGQARGIYDVVVTNPDGTSARQPAAFTVEQTRNAQVWADVIGLSTIRRNRKNTYYLLYGNRGNVDAPGALFFITVPRNVTLAPGPDFPTNTFLAGIDVEVPQFVQTNDSIILPFGVPTVSAGSTGAASFQLSVPDGQFDLSVYLVAPTFVNGQTAVSSRSIADSPKGSKIKSLLSTSEVAQNKTPVLDVRDLPALDEAANVLRDTWKTDNFVQRAIKEGVSCVEAAQSRRLLLQNVADMIGSNLQGWTIRTVTKNGFGFGHTTTLLTSPDGQRHYIADNYVEPTIVPMISINGGTAWIPTIESLALEGGSGSAATYLILDALIDSTFLISGGAPYYTEAPNTTVYCIPTDAQKIKTVRTIFTRDPNAKVGAQGVGPEQFISGAEPLRYGIFFENEADATALVQDVIITDQLDVSKFDLSTLSFGDISIGNTLVSVLAGQSNFAADIDLRPAKNIIVRISAALNTSTGLVTWQFHSIDPATDLPTTDPLAGFLPPNTDGSGEGSVLLTVLPKVELATGTQIRNRATIVFDNNAPMDTQEWLNTLDNSPPASQVLPLTVPGCATGFTVQWSGSDTGSGVESYSIFVSDNGGAFQPFLLNTSQISATFSGQAGHKYAFYSVARDNAGNRENKIAAPDVMVTLRTPTPPSMPCPANVTVNNDPGQCSARVSITAPAATDPCDGTLTPVATRSDQKPLTDPFPLGHTTITWSAQNSSGLRASCQQVITVNDKEAPRISCPSPQTAEFATDSGAAVSYQVTATDNCGGTVTIACTPPSGSTFPIGSTAVNCQATDAAGNFSTCSFTVTVLGARGVKQNVLNDMSALRATVTDKQDRDKLDEAINKLAQALDSSLWVDQTHLQKKGGENAINAEKDAVNKLRDLIKSTIPDATLQALIDRIDKCDRLFATVAIADAVSQRGNANAMAQARDELAKGDADIAQGKYESGLEHYREAWKAAVNATT